MVTISARSFLVLLSVFIAFNQKSIISEYKAEIESARGMKMEET